MQSPLTTKTALLLIDLQLGLTHPVHYGTSRSNPNLETNILTLRSAIAQYNSRIISEHSATPSSSSQKPPYTITTLHVHHHSTNPTSPLHPTRILDWDISPSISPFYANGHNAVIQKNVSMGIVPLPVASLNLPFYSPPPPPLVNSPPDPAPFIKSSASAFVRTELEGYIREHGIRQLIVCGTTVEHCVSTTVRMAGDSRVCSSGEDVDDGVLILVDDGVAAFNKGGIGAGMVHKVNVECLRGEFCDVMTTHDIVSILDKSG